MVFYAFLSRCSQQQRDKLTTLLKDKESVMPFLWPERLVPSSFKNGKLADKTWRDNQDLGHVAAVVVMGELQVWRQLWKNEPHYRFSHLQVNGTEYRVGLVDTRFRSVKGPRRARAKDAAMVNAAREATQAAIAGKAHLVVGTCGVDPGMKSMEWSGVSTAFVQELQEDAAQVQSEEEDGDEDHPWVKEKWGGFHLGKACQSSRVTLKQTLCESQRSQFEQQQAKACERLVGDADFHGKATADQAQSALSNCNGSRQEVRSIAEGV